MQDAVKAPLGSAFSTPNNLTSLYFHFIQHKTLKERLQHTTVDCIF